MQFSTPQIIIWYLNLVFQAGLIVVLVYTGLRKRFLWFFSYSLAELVSTLILMALVLPFTKHGYLSQFTRPYYAYFYSWEALQLIVFAFKLGVIWEIWHHVHLDKLAHANAFGGLLCFFVVVVALWSNYSPIPSTQPALQVMLTANRSIQFIICMMFISLVVLGGLLHLHWRHHIFCISAGLALYAAAGIVVSGLRSGSLIKPAAYHVLVNIRDVIYIVSLNVWIFGLLQAEPTPAPLTAEDVAKLKNILMLLREKPFYAHRK